MTIKTDYRVVFALPASFVTSMVIVYFTLVTSGFERQRALNILTIALVGGVLSLLRIVSRVPERTGSAELGMLVLLLLGTAALALRSISLAHTAGRLFYFTVLSQGGLAYFAIRIMRRMKRRAVSGANQRPTP